MKNTVALLLAVPAVALAQANFPTEFPSDSVPLTQEDLKKRLTGKTFVSKPASGSDIRVQYRDTYAYINIGNMSDTGTWRVEGSSVCYEWRQIRPSCSEVRIAGGVLHLKRANNGEILTLVEK